jgi:hypothetical protein
MAAYCPNYMPRVNNCRLKVAATACKEAATGMLTRWSVSRRRGTRIEKMTRTTGTVPQDKCAERREVAAPRLRPADVRARNVERVTEYGAG